MSRNRTLRKPASSARNQVSSSRRSSAIYPSSRRSPFSAHWLFRSNIPRRPGQYLPADPQKRNFFGMGEIFSVIANPAETVRSLTESKRLLEEARREILENRERAQLRPKHTFSRLPGFFPRQAEIKAVERALQGEPSFTVLFGASSVGKTALLREVLSSPKYHVLHFDLRIAGFADLASLYMSLSQQMEQYFEEVSNQMEGYQEFEKEAWSFKHDRLNVEKRLADSVNGNAVTATVRTSDVARLMELFQSSLLKYWEFQPLDKDSKDRQASSRQPNAPRRQDSNETRGGGTEYESDRTRVGSSPPASDSRRSWWARVRTRVGGRHSSDGQAGAKGSKGKQREHEPEKGSENGEKTNKPEKKVPVIFFDEAHRLPALIQSTETMKCILDSMLVLTKQDRLCHVIHATSDPFYQTWLRQLNVMQHCKIITIGDCSKSETRTFFRESLLPRVPTRLKAGLDFERLFDAFGGKLVHLHDYVTDYSGFFVVLFEVACVLTSHRGISVNSNGTLDIKQSSHFLQAHALLNLHIIHSSQASQPPPSGQHPNGSAVSPTSNNARDAESLHPGLGPAGFKIYSPITWPHRPSSSLAVLNGENRFGAAAGNAPPSETADFTAMQLLRVMSRLTQPGVTSLPYFLLCRELGVREVDGMVKGRVLDLRWTDCVTREDADEARSRRSAATGAGSGHVPADSSWTMVDLSPAVGNEEAPRQGGVNALADISEPEPIALGVSGESRGTEGGRFERYPEQSAPGYSEDELDMVVGPKLVPTTPLMRYAMREVVAEYEEQESNSEYASLSDVDEY
ncbi:hypothetical protein HGRIS_012348 [Hohenbuehelia grisea]|uniref:AAA+ ATPase domain-containing protein n=1 Tax=Hohenbuehelia grisea TaxID=104357 RepID=A0ABR3IS58_9AGAR